MSLLSRVGSWFSDLPRFLKLAWKPFLWLGIQLTVYGVWMQEAIKGGFRAFRSLGFFPIRA
jgi:hypothetical protein